MIADDAPKHWYSNGKTLTAKPTFSMADAVGDNAQPKADPTPLTEQDRKDRETAARLYPNLGQPKKPAVGATTEARWYSSSGTPSERVDARKTRGAPRSVVR